jgi:hypothetical protein
VIGSRVDPFAFPKSGRVAIALLPVWLAASPVQAELAAAPLGKQRAAASRLEWEIREAGHPVLGDIRFGVLKTPVETPVGSAKVFSRAYLSCQKDSRKFAIELTNTIAPDDPGGLLPSTLPRLVCHRPEGGTVVDEELLAHWEVSAIGDAMARGFRAFPLRECVSIGVSQEVALPKGWAEKTARVEFEIIPYDRNLDSVFVACGDTSAYAPAERSPKPQDAASPWRTARISSGGKTNVRAGPTLKSATVTQLFPGDIVLVQRAKAEWWRARSRPGVPAFEGYIREDRLVFP